MKIGTRLVVLAVIILLSFSYGQGGYSFDMHSSNPSQFTFVGNAQTTNDGIRLTSATSNQFGGAFYGDLVSVKNFITSFSFRLSEAGGNFTDCEGATGADGLVFVMQSIDPVVDPSAIGGAIGYEGIPNSIGVEFDTWCNTDLNDLDSNHVSIHINGVIDEQPNTSVWVESNDTAMYEGNYLSIPGDFMDGEVWSGTISYDPSSSAITVNISSSNSPKNYVLFRQLNLSDAFISDYAYVGFTSATGGAWGNHDILQWDHFAETPEMEVQSTPWTLHEGYGNIPLDAAVPTHGHPNLYNYMTIPAEDDFAWRALYADEKDVAGNINYSKASALPSGSCFNQADFTYIQSSVFIPANASFTSVQVGFDKVDDGARAYIFNSTYPNGVYLAGGDIVLGGDSVTEDLSSLVEYGERNRIVIVQVDDCPVENNLINAQVYVDGVSTAIGGSEGY